MIEREADLDQSLFRRIPQVDRLLAAPEFQPLIEAHSRAEVTLELRHDLDELRARGARGELTEADLALGAIHDRVALGLADRARPYYRRVINGTGIVLHTGLGRAPLPSSVVTQIADRVGYPLRVEIDLETGQRGGRGTGCEELLEEITGCEAAVVVNNNAGATLLTLSALARDKEVIVSRGELVEIGGSYRVPDIMQEGGAQLIEVGTTNRTHRKDYVSAITENTGMLLKVHTSNYLVQGFTKEVEIEELSEIGREHGVPAVHDLGSGCLVDLEKYGIVGEPFVPHSVTSGADLICFSGDKLLGGPQAGIILGRRELVERCRRHPLYRAMRPGRLTYVALESTLRIYREGEASVLDKIPALRRLTASPDELAQRAGRLADRLKGLESVRCEIVPCTSQAGSGSLPTRNLASHAVRITPNQGSLDSLARFLRLREPAILARTVDDALLLDVRTLEDDEFPLIEQALSAR